MGFAHTLDGTTYRFADLKDLLAKASPTRSGDELAGVAAGSGAERVAAQMALAEAPLAQFLNDAVVPYERDEVTRLIVDTHDAAAFAPVRSLTVGDCAIGCCARRPTPQRPPRLLPVSRPRWRRV